MSDVTEAAGGEAVSTVAPGLYWAVRESFVQYVLENPDGGMFADDGVETDGQGMFRFPFRSAARSDDEWRLEFAGELRFTAHFGMLDVTIVRPVVELSAEGGVLTVEVGDRRVPLVAVAPARPVDVEGGLLVFPPLPTALTSEAVPLFGDSYPADSRFDPLRIAIPAAEVTS